MFLLIARTFKQSLLNLRRNGWLSIAATSVLILSLYVVGVLYVLTTTANQVLQNIESKINVSVYFKSDVTEDKILSVKGDLEKYSEIKSIDYVTKDQALEEFKKNNADEPVILESLKEIGENPLLASLVIKANNPDQYETISNYINGADYKNDISRINYGKNKLIIEKLNKIIRQIKKVGSLMAVIFAVVSILIIFNTIRITIYVHKQEIEVMRLVGASNMFIRLPFIFEGILYGVAASLLATFILFITIKFINPYASIVITSQNLMSFYLSRFFPILGIQAALGVVLGVIASWFAMRKYLKI
jgi:cell division transport system permease protein